jgi:hypothetical protein
MKGFHAATMKRAIEECNINFIQSTSVEYLQTMEIGKYDLIYIDTDHEYQNTKQEITLALEKLHSHQLLSGHDYSFPGVHLAIKDIFGYPDLEVFLDNSWVLTNTLSGLKVNRKYKNIPLI